MSEYKTRVTRLTVLPEGEPIFSEKATHVEIDDEAGGEFVKVSQIFDHAKPGEIGLEPDNWPAIRDAIETLMKDLRPLA